MPDSSGNRRRDVGPLKANSMLADWWYLTKQIAECQEELTKIGKKSSKRMRQLYRKAEKTF